MHLHPRHRIVWLAHPRTASVATEKALESVGFEPVKRRSRHLRLEEAPADVAGWSVWTTVRNHFDAIVSWRFLKRFDLAWGVDYVKAIIRTTAEYLEPRRLWALHGEDATVTFRYETLERDLNRALGAHGLGPVTIPRLNVSTERQGRPAHAFYDDRLRRYVGRLFGREMAAYGYSYPSPGA